MVQFHPWFQFDFLLFETHYYTSPYHEIEPQQMNCMLLSILKIYFILKSPWRSSVPHFETVELGSVTDVGKNRINKVNVTETLDRIRAPTANDKDDDGTEDGSVCTGGIHFSAYMLSSKNQHKTDNSQKLKSPSTPRSCGRDNASTHRKTTNYRQLEYSQHVLKPAQGFIFFC